MTASLRYDASIGRITQERLFPQQLPAFVLLWVFVTGALSTCASKTLGRPFSSLY